MTDMLVFILLMWAILVGLKIEINDEKYHFNIDILDIKNEHTS